jgi:lipopolysaccharide transport system ATP-binding protein
LGEVILRGRVASLLEVGTGFVGDLSGRDNIFLNGAILGMTKAEIRSKFDEIVAFAEVEQFIDTPVKRYSSGMYVRLAFAVAAHLEPDILIVDEVLAVGDSQFQKKCLGKMGDVANQGRTILFVSHNMTAVRTLCRTAIMLAGGEVVANGPTAPVVAQYLQHALQTNDETQWSAPESAPGDDCIRIRRVRVSADGGSPDGLLTMQAPLRIETEFWVLQGGRAYHLTYHLINDQGITVLTTGGLPWAREPGVYKTSFRIPDNLLNSGGYFLKLLIVRNENQIVYENESIAAFSLADAAEREYAVLGREPGVIQVALPWSAEIRTE